MLAHRCLPTLKVPPAWLDCLAFPINAAQLAMGIIQRVNTAAGGGGVVGNMLIVRNNTRQYSNIKVHLGYLGLDPLIQQAALHLPLGRLLMAGDKRHRFSCWKYLYPNMINNAVHGHTHSSYPIRTYTVRDLLRIRLVIFKTPSQICYTLKVMQKASAAFPSNQSENVI